MSWNWRVNAALDSDLGLERGRLEVTSQQLAKLNTPTKMKNAAGLPSWASPGLLPGLRTFSSSCTYHYTGPSMLQRLTRRSQTPVAHYLAHSSAPNPPKTHLHSPSMHALCCLWCSFKKKKKKKITIGSKKKKSNIIIIIYKTYYTSQREIWWDISRAEGEWNISPYLTADECNKCFILRGTPPGPFSHWQMNWQHSCISIIENAACMLKLPW